MEARMTQDVDANLTRSRRLYEEIFGKGNYGALPAIMRIRRLCSVTPSCAAT